MRPCSLARRFAALAACLALIVAGCGSKAVPVPVATAPPLAASATPPAPLKDEIPTDRLDAVMKAHLTGLGAMEQYEYRKAAEAFGEAHKLAPGWIPGSINLAIALLNDTGTQAEDSKADGGGQGGNFGAALALLNDVLVRDPDHLHAHYCRGLILAFLGEERTAEAHKDFLFVTQKDPADGHAWYKLGSTLTVPGDPSQPAGPAQADELIRLYSKALECNPYLVTAIFKLQSVYGLTRQRDKQLKLLDAWRALNPKTNAAAPGDTAEAFYGESGKYSKVINPLQITDVAREAVRPPRFEPPAALKTSLPDGDRWADADDFQGPDAVLGRARVRFGATAVSFDADGDGGLDLFLPASVKTAKGVRDALLIRQADESFVDVTKAWGLGEGASLGAAAADFDADRRVDLFLTGPAGYRLLRNNAGKAFIDATPAEMASPDLGLTARWLDLDQDGDLDLYVVNATTLEKVSDAFSEREVTPVRNRAFRNDGKPAAVQGRPADNWAPLAVAPPDLPAKSGLSIVFKPWPDAEALSGPPAHYSAVAALDIDDDRDLDLVLASDDAPPSAVLNDRLGKFHAQPIPGLKSGRPVQGLLVIDFDKDGRPDLATVGKDGAVVAYRNVCDTSTVPRTIGLEPRPSNAPAWSFAQAADLDLDTWPDLVGLPTKPEVPVVDWGRNDGARLENRRLAYGPGPVETPRLAGFTLADLAGDALPDLLILADGVAPQIAQNLGNGRHWIALDLGGRWKTSFDHMRTNPHGLGTKVTLQGQGLLVTYDHTTPSAGLGQSVGPIVLGLDQSPSVELIRLRWPDGTMQCELNEKADTRLALSEFNRKKGSCPVLFTWNGDRFVCLGDFLGGGGLGYLVAPGVYGQPDRTESVAITSEQLKPVGGVFRISVTEPMDEVAYLDRLELVVVDRPPGVASTPDERFAPEGPRPTGEVVAWRDAIEPKAATDLKGRDVAKALKAWDRDTVDQFRKLDGWVGYAEEHGIVLDFGDRLARFGPADPLLLVAAGWVEYPYSQTNYAAATAGLALKPPAAERRNPDGTWSVIEPNAGYPAGLPRLTTLDLTGKLTGPDCVIRLKTNMECYYDQVFVAPRDKTAEASLRQTSLPVARARLSQRGYTREVSPDGKQPLLYDYDYVDPSPLALMAGRLTRHGDVTPLLNHDDDQLCLVGPGDEVRAEFDGRSLPALPDGWTRAYVLKSVGYCKDADPHTAGSDSVEPLPWQGMPEYPFTSPAARPLDDAYRAYLRAYQTRPAGGR